jgi:hypothetical protein
MAQEISDQRPTEFVCTVCSAIVEKRSPDTHLQGKQHRAYDKIRQNYPLSLVKRHRSDSSISFISQ